MIKIGTWIRTLNHSEIGQVESIIEGDIKKFRVKELDYLVGETNAAIWQPRVGEFVWFGMELYELKSIEGKLYIFSNDNCESFETETLKFCEPFLNLLPSKLR